MIVSTAREKYDGQWRIVNFRFDEAGACEPELAESTFDEYIDQFYQQKEKEMRRLLDDLNGGAISPVGFFTRLFNMNERDLAARMKLRPGVVKRHATPAGFSKVTVETLQRYARVFDVTVADFFQFTFLGDGVRVEHEPLLNRLLQHVTVSAR